MVQGIEKVAPHTYVYTIVGVCITKHFYAYSETFTQEVSHQQYSGQNKAGMQEQADVNTRNSRFMHFSYTQRSEYKQ